MLPPLPRCSGWAYSTLISPSHVSLPRKGHRVGLHIVLFEACSAFTRVAACTLARSPYFVTRYPKASDISSPPCLLRLLPAGAVAGWDLHPLESAAFSRRTPKADFEKPLTVIFTTTFRESDDFNSELTVRLKKISGDVQAATCDEDGQHTSIVNEFKKNHSYVKCGTN